MPRSPGLSDADVASLEQDSLVLIGQVEAFHAKWCESPTFGSAYLPCGRLMKLLAALDTLVVELGPFD